MIVPTVRRKLGKQNTIVLSMNELKDMIAKDLEIAQSRLHLVGIIDHDHDQEDRLHSEGPLPQIVTGIEVTIK